MNTINQLSRRKFLQLTGLSTSGLMLMGTVPLNASAADVLATSEGHTLCLFVSINDNGRVDIVTHRSEMGTGIRTSLPQVVADEMEADWQQVKVIQGLANVDYGSQNTDGSRSVRDFYHIMRQMGASAKHLLEHAAAKQWNVSVSECHAKNHAVYHDSGKTLGFGELAATAGKIPLPDLSSLSLKNSSDFSYIGKNIPIVDLHDMTVGNTIYGIDVSLPEMLYASIERTPVLDGKFSQYNASAAKQTKGVVEVIEIKGKPLPAMFNAIEGVAVIATNTFSAIKGRQALNVQWQANEHSTHNSETYLDQLSDTVTNQAGEIFRQRGDTDAGLKAANKTIEATYRTPYLAHASMEPPMATAHWHDGICEIWACTQTPQRTQQTVAEAFGLTTDQVIVHVTLLGGGFGRKSKPDFSVEAATLAKHMDKPVQVVWSREDDIHHDYFHSCSAQYFKGGLDDTGQVTAWLARAAAPTISSTFSWGNETLGDNHLGMSFGTIPFDIPNLQLERHAAETHARIGWLRSVYNIPFGFGVGSFVDELAHAAGKDPKDFWLELIGPDRELEFASEGLKFSNYGRSFADFPYETQRFKNVITTLTEKMAWGEKLPQGQGWGLTALRSFLSYVAVACKVEVISGTLKVTEMHCVIDCGTVVNPDRVHAQLEGGLIFGLSLALMGQIDFVDGQTVQSNFHDYPVARINQTPPIIKTHIIDSDRLPAGVGEPGVPPVAPSIANAIFAATGQRIRELPLNKHFNV
jgi:isoquinoline 1-oxidoreductase beta subunit